MYLKLSRLCIFQNMCLGPPWWKNSCSYLPITASATITLGRKQLSFQSRLLFHLFLCLYKWTMYLNIHRFLCVLDLTKYCWLLIYLSFIIIFATLTTHLWKLIKFEFNSEKRERERRKGKWGNLQQEIGYRNMMNVFFLLHTFTQQTRIVS